MLAYYRSELDRVYRLAIGDRNLNISYEKIDWVNRSYYLFLIEKGKKLSLEPEDISSHHQKKLASCQTIKTNTSVPQSGLERPSYLSVYSLGNHN